ncbi:class I SAM-dependent methyltransferase [Actinomadura sp. 9N407]|uniref:class I SAM-dependent methyltransferase n=1 Tax=Actinomadura sp. 9N407 TaxID=3375154 RepID=UPI003798750A
MSGCILDRLGLCRKDRVADIGCGTGLYARGLAERAGSVVCVDPSAEMLERLPDVATLIPVRASLENLATGTSAVAHERFDAVLAKEVLHHAADRDAALRALAGLVAPGGRLLIVLLAPVLGYPLFDAALERYGRHPVDPADLARRLEECGLRAEVSTESFRLAVAKDTWLGMVADRWMSLLAKFNDNELAAGIAEIDARHGGPVLEFDDVFVFVTARRVG